MSATQELGNWGEDEAVKWLQVKGMEILERNWRFGRYEMDIIARDRHRLVFVEVKARSNDFFEAPEDSVVTAKQKRLLESGMAYAEKTGFDGPVRFDVISLVSLPYGKKLLHIPDAFFPLGSDI